jgi:hypothetical protein
MSIANAFKKHRKRRIRGAPLIRAPRLYEIAHDMQRLYFHSSADRDIRTPVSCHDDPQRHITVSGKRQYRLVWTRIFPSHYKKLKKLWSVGKWFNPIGRT